MTGPGADEETQEYGLFCRVCRNTMATLEQYNRHMHSREGSGLNWVCPRCKMDNQPKT